MSDQSNLLVELIKVLPGLLTAEEVALRFATDTRSSAGRTGT